MIGPSYYDHQVNRMFYLPKHDEPAMDVTANWLHNPPTRGLEIAA